MGNNYRGLVNVIVSPYVVWSAPRPMILRMNSEIKLVMLKSTIKNGIVINSVSAPLDL